MDIHDFNRTELESFVLDNPELDRLEGLLKQFNIFEALGSVRHELRHSDFIAFLLDPMQKHGLRDEFAKLFLTNVLQLTDNREFAFLPKDLSKLRLKEIEVYREWQNIDILLIDNVNNFAVIIENKIGSAEHSNQLQRYRQIIAQRFPQLNIIGIFLTPDGDLPSDEFYIAIDYSIVSKTIKEVTRKYALRLESDVKTLMTHYIQMLERHIMSESEIAKLCRQIYKDHRLALDLIFEHRLDHQANIKDHLENLINEEPALQFEPSEKTKLRFTARDWNKPNLLTGFWEKSKQILMFEFWIKQNSLNLFLFIYIGPENIRQTLIEMTQTNNSIFKYKLKQNQPNYIRIYDKEFLKAKDFEDESNLENKINESWNECLNKDIPQILTAVKNNQKLWQITLY